jgi:hypothetical protein
MLRMVGMNMAHKTTAPKQLDVTFNLELEGSPIQPQSWRRLVLLYDTPCFSVLAPGLIMFNFPPPSDLSRPSCNFNNHASRVGVMDLLRWWWFSRVWVLQEVAAAKDVAVMCGYRVVGRAGRA